MGMWFLTSAVSGFTGAKLASLVHISKDIKASPASFSSFAHLFGEIAFVILIISALMACSIKFMQRLTK
jgi:dipeptide/tripeptide permease